MGNIIELCAAQLYPDPKISLGFTMCITREYQNIPNQDLIEACALEHAIDIRQLNECAAKDDGAYGVGLLRDSVTRTAEVSSPSRLTFRAFQCFFPFAGKASLIPWRLGHMPD